MKKLVALLTALGLAACLNAAVFAEDTTEAADAVDHTQGEKITWILPQGQTADNPAVVASFALADALKEATGGRWTLEVYAGGQLGAEYDTLEMCRENTVQMMYANISTMESYVPDFGVFVLPYLFHSWDDVEAYLSTAPKCADLWDRLEEATNLKFVAVQFNGARCLSTCGIDPVKSPADLKGVKIRAMEAPVWQNVISSLGGTPVPVAFNELYVALQTGVVQGQDNPLAVTYFQKFYEVLDDLYMTEHCYNISTIVVNSDAWNALSEEDQALFNELYQEYMVDYYNEIYADFEDQAIQTMKDANCRIWEQEDLDMDAFYKSAEEMIDREYMTDELFAGYITDIRETFGY